MMVCGALRSLVTILFVSAIAASSAAHDKTDHRPDEFDRDRALANSRAAIGREVRNVDLRDRRGRRLDLTSFRGKPLVVSFIYTSCVHICPTITKQVAEAVEIGRDALGDDSFSVLTIGFDTKVDTPDRMRYFADRYGIDDPGWKFVAADSRSVKTLADDLGFLYFRSPNGFDHLSQTTVIDAEGRVADQIYGDSFPPPALVDVLKRLVLGTTAGSASLSGLIDKIRILCTVYDPTTRRYGFDYSILISAIIGLACLGGVAVFLARGWLDSRRRQA